MPRAILRPSLPRFFAWSVCVATALVAGVIPVAAADWPAITPAESALKAPRVDPQADAEALLWDVRLTDSDDRDEVSTILQHHIRIKIFSDRGREANSKVELPYTPRRRVREVEGRTIAPNGTITELRGQDIFDRTIIEAGGLKVRVKSFVMPSVVPGSIIEYRWKEVRDDSVANYLELPLQRDIPTHVVRYHIKPLAVRAMGFQMRTEWYNAPRAPEQAKEENGYTVMLLRDVPALRPEPYMPAELAIKPWILIYYQDLADASKTPEKFWLDYAKSSHGAFKPYIKTTNELRQAAAELSKRNPDGVTAAALVAFARERIKRDDTDTSDVVRRKDNKSVSDALKRGTGIGEDQTLLVAALAPLVGLETRLALLPDRSEFLSTPSMRQPHFVSRLAVAVQTPQGWQFVDPANEHAKDGHLRWQQEGQYALLLDDKAPQFVSVPVTPQQHSTAKREAALKLLDSGALEGEVTLSYSGHLATRYRERDDDETPADRVQTVTNEFTKRQPGAVVSNVRFEHLEDPQQPYVVRFAVSVPNYAQKTGSRLFVQPAVLERGAEAMFPEGTRTQRIHFPYAWLEEDTVTIDLPEGYEIEPDPGLSPAILGVGAGIYTAKVALAPEGRRVTYTRAFSIGGQGKLFWEPKDYAAIKAFFDGVRQDDGYTMSLRRER